MYSVKPGRGSSFMGGFMGLFMVCFGVVWTVFASRAAFFLAFFGIAFVIMGIFITIFGFKNATSKNRYSAYDITTDEEEPDPLNLKYHGSGSDTWTNTSTDSTVSKGGFCPYCGAGVDAGFLFCNKCGRKLPGEES